jgi:putative hydrolase of the HAD superfamily
MPGPTAPFPKADTRPDFRHVESWIFDLDNTLYPAKTDLFAQIDARMSTFVAERLGLSLSEARAIQKAYYREHGTTLNGLMRMNGVDPEAYLAFVHDIDLSPLSRDPQLESAIARLPGKRFIFTNGCRHHAARVLDRLALSHLFAEVWDIRTIGFCPKPDMHAYSTVLARAGTPAHRTSMFEDAARNLVPAHLLGMTTVWLRNGSTWSKQGPEHPIAGPEHVHYEIEHLPQFLEQIRI